MPRHIFFKYHVQINAFQEFSEFHITDESVCVYCKIIFINVLLSYSSIAEISTIVFKFHSQFSARITNYMGKSFRTHQDEYNFSICKSH